MHGRAGLIPALVLLCAVAARAQDAQTKTPQPTWRQIVGFDAAAARLRPEVPTGRQIAVGYVEGGGTDYPPDPNHKNFARINLLLRSGEANPSSHATHGATIAFGSQGIAPGVDTIHAFSSPHWLTEGYLNTGRPVPPVEDGLRLFNHSWIAGPSPPATQVLRRIDWVIDQRDVIMCVGVNNGRHTEVPAMLASAYNVIAVGTAKDGGDSSGGYTKFEIDGRCKPDLVGPRDLTSFATPSVTGCCAVLMERAAALGDERASRSELIKAALLAGAVKPKPWSATEAHPLDEHLGAGIVNVDRSLQVLDAGPLDGRQMTRHAGWSYVQLPSGGTRSFYLETARFWQQATITAVWNRRIDGRTARIRQIGQNVWLDSPRLANIDLVLTHYDDLGRATELAASRSTADNVEHLYRRVLAPGRYRIDVVRGDDRLEEEWDVALAWWMHEAQDPIEEPTQPPQPPEILPPPEVVPPQVPSQNPGEIPGEVPGETSGGHRNRG